jgi:hypothetical protein
MDQRMSGYGYDAAIARTAKRTEYAGHMYASRAEAAYAATLDLLKAGGEVVSWERQVPLACTVNGVKVCTYYADFRITHSDGTTEWVDVKGRSQGSALFKLKAKLVRACHGIELRIA